MTNTDDVNIALGNLNNSKEEIGAVLNKSDGVSHFHSFNIKPNPVPTGKGLVKAIVDGYKSDEAIWDRLFILGYEVKNLKKEKHIRKMGMKEYLGTNFPKPVLERLYAGLNNIDQKDSK